jgi:hypothetical protein
MVMPLSIRDDEIRVMAQGLAKARRATVTEVVKRALQRELRTIDGEREWRDRELRRLFAGFDAHPPQQDFDDAEMHDEDGLPR